MNTHKHPSRFMQILFIVSIAAFVLVITPPFLLKAQDATPDLGNLSPGVVVPDEPVTVTFASWVGQGPAYQQLAAQFHELYPNITIEFQDVPAEEMRTKLLTQVAANNPPDVAFMDQGSVGEFASRGALLNLDSYIAESTAINLDDYVDAFLDASIYEGSAYGLPIDAETTGLFYRTDLFEAAGIEAPPTTWEELREDAALLTDPDNRQYGFILFAPESAYYWYPWLWQAGGDLLTPEGEIRFNDEAAKRAAEFYVSMRDFSPPDFLNSNSWDGRVAFAEGTVAMYVAGAWFAGTLQSEFPDINGLWATAPLPSDQQCATTIAGDNLVIFAGSDHPEAAWKWIEFLSVPEHMALINLGTPEEPTTMLPPRQTLLDDPATFANNPVLQGFADNMPCAVVGSELPPRWPEVEQILNDQLARAIYGEVDAATALDEAALEAEAILEDQ
jgi:multiple sugar transport system substrate-binding protein